MRSHQLGVIALVAMVAMAAAPAAAGRSRDARSLLRCQRQITEEGVYFTNRMNARLARCLVPLADCAVADDGRAAACARAADTCGDLPADRAGFAARLASRLGSACRGLAIPDLMQNLAFADSLQGCTATTLPAFAGCLSDALTDALAASWVQLAPAACGLVEAQGLGALFPRDPCAAPTGDPGGGGDPPPSDVTAFCGGPNAVACPAGFVCDPASSVCDPLAGGACVAAPGDCSTAPADPVCGCDGTTYASDCARLAAGVAVAHAGSCNVGCVMNDECPSGMFCELPAGDCGESQMGVCRPMNDPACAVCSDLASGRVCGCDGVTYMSECERRAAGASKLTDGSCF
jgi:hypothetical protein